MTLTIRHKLILLACSGLVTVSILGTVSYRGLHTLGEALTDAEVAAAALRNHLEADMMHDAIRGDVLAALLATTAEAHAGVREEFDDHAAHFADMVREQDALPLPGTVSSALRDVRSALDTYVAIGDRIIAAAAKSSDSGHALYPEFDERYGTLEERMATVSTLIERTAKETTDAGHANRDWLMSVLLVAGSIAALLFGGIAYAIGRSILLPLHDVTARMKDISEGDGDLTVRVDYAKADELGALASAFNQFAAKVNRSVAGISTAAQQLATAAEELAATNHQMSAHAEEATTQTGGANTAAQDVTDNVRTVASSTEQMTFAINEIANSAANAARVAGDAVRVSGEANQMVTQLGEASREISKVIDTIAAVAQQTNLLALNANIEAARAGEAGKGFAVVANAVKDLANQTGQSTSEIRAKIEGVQAQIAAVVTSITHVTTVIEEINDLQSSIASAVEEQSATAAEIRRTISDAATGTERIAGLLNTVTTVVEGTSSGAANGLHASTTLARMAGQLQELVGQFRFQVDEDGTAGASPTTGSSDAGLSTRSAPAVTPGEPAALDIDTEAFASIRNRRWTRPGSEMTPE